ncbi:MAG: hypothetical protein IJY42_03945, partial [Clostridia bacterium]|nr:hypothetical protein [Clostridia bacterium]
MKAEHIKQKVVGFCKKIGKRNFMIAGALVLIAAAVCINVAIVASDKDQGFDYSQGSSMDGQGTTQAPGGSSTDSTATGDSYFSSVQVSRQRTRDEA